jgi:tetratricopeptide (TPR) repeat protein
MLKKLIHEMHRRSLWQVLLIYLGASWLVLQAVDTLAGALSLPDWAPPLALFLLIVGVPIVVATAFVQEGMGGEGPKAAGVDASVAAAIEATTELSETQQPTAPSAAVPEQGARYKIFTWRKALLGGVAALALVGALSVGYMATRTLGVGPAATLVARGVLEDRATIILAEFDSRTGDSLLARAATEAFRIDLSQSDAVRIAEPAFVANAMRRMERGTGAELDYATARELAQREGVAAIVDGDINSAGGTYVLAVRLTSPETGEELAAFRETAKDSTEIVPAIDKLSKRLRERIGDSYRSLRADEPLEQVTTANLEALRKYSQALDAIEAQDQLRGIALLEEAIALDPEFAMAWRKLGVELNNRGDSRQRSVEALSMAFEYRDRLTERERYLTMATYYNQVAGDQDRALQAYQNMLDLDPDDTWALNNLALIYQSRREFDRAEELYTRAIDVDSTSPLYYRNAVFALTGQGKFAEAEAMVETQRRRFPGTPFNEGSAALVAAAQLDYASAESELLAMLEAPRLDPSSLSFARGSLASLLVAQGRLAEAAEHRREAAEANEARGIPGSLLQSALGGAFTNLLIHGDTAAAVAGLETVLEANPISEISPLDRPYFFLALFYAAAGDAERAKRIWAEYDEAVAPGLRGNDQTARHSIGGAIAYSEGRYEEAIREFRRADEEDCVTCVLYPLARSYEASAEADSALSTYAQLLSRPDPFRLFTDQGTVALTYERLGEIHYERGDWDRAAEYYAKFVQIWREADPELQPRVAAAQGRLEEIFSARG